MFDVVMEAAFVCLQSHLLLGQQELARSLRHSDFRPNIDRETDG